MKVDPAIHREILARYERLKLSPYKGFINPVYNAVRDAQGNITDVKISYDEASTHKTSATHATIISCPSSMSDRIVSP